LFDATCPCKAVISSVNLSICASGDHVSFPAVALTFFSAAMIIINKRIKI
jgi:hypothetical protein